MTWDRLSPRALERLQGEQLDQWVNHEVKPFSQYWRKRIGVRPVTTLADLRTLDVVTEAEVASAGGPGNPDLLLLPTEDGFKRHASRADLLAASREVGKGGEQGRRAALFRRYKPVHVHEAGVDALLAVAYTRSDLDRLHLAGARLTEVLGLGADDSLVNAVPAGPSVRFWGLYHAALAARMTALHPRGKGEDPVRPVLRALALLPATALAVPVAEAQQLLTALAGRVTVPGLRTVVTVGPPPTAEQRAALARLAERLSGRPVRIQAVWAPETSRTLWGECRPASADPHEATYGLHTYPDLEVVEVRDLTTGAAAGEAEPGEIVLTSLGWRGTALVRFATGAWTGGLTSTTPCPACGRTVPRLAPAAADGAWQPRVAARGATVRADLRLAYRVLDSEALARIGVRHWSLRPQGTQLVLAVDGDADRAVLLQLGQQVSQAVGADVAVRVDAQLAQSRPQVGRAGG